MDLNKKYDKFNREALCQVLRMYNVSGKLSNMYVNSLAYVRVKEAGSKCFRNYSGVRQGCVMSS